MCTEVNSAMGLQATAATKRKHDLTFDAKDTNTYTNCPPPVKASKWSLNNNNYIDAVDEQKVTAIVNGYKASNNNNNNNNNNNENKSCEISCSSTVTSISLRNGKEVPKLSTPAAPTPAMLNTTVVVSEVDATTPLPPTSTTPVPENNIAKLEVVANVACEPWTSTPEPVDCISKLQAVAVPSDPWGSISTRSTLATTLLSADELDDDDDDFEDDYEEEESIIPTYCPLRYHTFPSSNSSSSNLQGQRVSGSFPSSPSQSYVSRPNYYSEPFPQQNCSRTGSPPHMRQGSNGFVWPSGPNSATFYTSAESNYTPQQQQQPQQQTIRCAENGKSYLELGCSSPAPNPNSSPVLPPTAPFIASGLEARLPIKRCCDGRGTWCSNNKACYKDIRLKIRNLSMFKLSRFRQVSEQSLYRSVLICNTLKRIDREIEAEAKEMHQVTAHVAQQQQHHLQHSIHQQPQYHHHLHSHMQIQSPMSAHNNVHQQQQPLQQHHSQQPMLHPQHQDYMPVLNCGRLGGNVEYHNQQQQQHQQHPSPHTFHQQHHHYQSERVLEITPPAFQNNLQKPATTSPQFTTTTQGTSNGGGSMTTTTTLHPYDHYPFRESNSGRVTPFPCQPVISTPPPASASSATSSSSSSPASSQVQSVATASATSTTLSSAATTTLISDTDSGFADDDSTRSINWSSVLSLSSQSALDPLNNNDIFSILPPANPATAVPVSVTSTVGACEKTTASSSVAISGTFTTVQSSGTTSSSNSCNTSTTPPSATTTATFTTLSTISSATHSLTSSYVTSMNSHSVSAATWEYGFLDMEFGLGTEFTELAPSCKFSSADDLFKNSLTPVSSTRYDNELEQPAHIMVGS